MADDNTIEILNTNYEIEVQTTQYDIQVDTIATSDYQQLYNKPQINSQELIGNLSASDLGLVSVSQLSQKENLSNKITEITSSSTDEQYPSAKCVYDEINNIESTLENYVPTTRTINGKSLTTNINLQAADVNALADTTAYANSLSINNNLLSLLDLNDTVLSNVNLPEYIYTGQNGISVTNSVISPDNGYQIPTTTQVTQIATNKNNITILQNAGYQTASQVNTAITTATSNFITKDVNNLTNYTKTSDLATVATSGSYNDLSNLPAIPTVPTNVGDFTNDVGYQTSTQVLNAVSTHNTSNTAHSDIRTALASKQPSGDYATNIALTNGLASKYDATNPSCYQTASQVSTAITSMTLPNTTKYGAGLNYANSQLQLKDQDGNLLGNAVTISGGGGGVTEEYVTTQISNHNTDVTAHTTKADTNASNFTTQGKDYLSIIGFPNNNRFISMTLGATGSTYTAPANGYFSLIKNSGNGQTSSSLVLRLNNNYKILSRMFITEAGSVGAVSLPVKKGDQVITYYTATGATDFFGFVYAEGASE